MFSKETLISWSTNVCPFSTSDTDRIFKADWHKQDKHKMERYRAELHDAYVQVTF